MSAADLAAKMDHPDARLWRRLMKPSPRWKPTTAPAAVIVMSAGDAPQIGAEFLKYLMQRRKVKGAKRNFVGARLCASALTRAPHARALSFILRAFALVNLLYAH
ncbi:MAG: hypothetical protein U0703_10885 [Anaerolineae bacterium]